MSWVGSSFISHLIQELQFAFTSRYLTPILSPWFTPLKRSYEILLILVFSMGEYVDVLRFLDAGASEVGEVDALLVSARQTFRLVEPWFQACSEHPIVDSIISNIREQTCVYFDAIEMSVQTAGIGYTFAEDAISLCEFIAQGRSSSEVIGFVKDMQKIACEARDAADTATQKFRSVRQGIFAVTNLVASSMEQIQREVESAHRSKVKHQQRAHYAGTMTSVIGSISPALGLIPHAVIILPALIPLLYLAEFVKTASTTNAEVREQQEMTCEKALGHLEQINDDLGALVDNVSRFSNWWISMHTLLYSIIASSGHLQPQKLDGSRVTIVHGRWEEVKRKYLLYKLGISRLQDFLPSYGANRAKLSLTNQTHRKYLASLSLTPSNPVSQIDLSQTVISLATSVEECRIALDKLKPGHLRANSGAVSDSSVKLKRFRMLMKEVWEELVLYLRDFHVFSHEIAVLAILDLGNKRDEGKGDIWATVTKLLTQAVIVKCNHIAAFQTMQRYKDAIMAPHIPSAMSRPAPLSFSLIQIPSLKSKGDKNKRGFHRVAADEGQTDILEGTKSLNAVEGSMMVTMRYLDELVFFWHDRLNVYGLIEDASLNKSDSTQLSYVWQVYGAAVEASLLSISKSCDALVKDVVDISPLTHKTGGLWECAWRLLSPSLS